jgi:hypothetical protein
MNFRFPPRRSGKTQQVRDAEDAILLYQALEKAVGSLKKYADPIEPVKPQWNHYILVAINYAQAQFFARQQGLKNWKYASSLESLRGLNERIVIYLPGCWKNRDYREIDNEIKLLERLGYVRVETYPTYPGSKQDESK